MIQNKIGLILMAGGIVFMFGGFVLAAIGMVTQSLPTLGYAAVLMIGGAVLNSSVTT